MVSDLNDSSQRNEFEAFRSHPDKSLRTHVDGVTQGLIRRTSLPFAKVASLFHDLGKLNPNFQDKLDGADTGRYSNHSYLSTYAFLCFCASNPAQLRELGLTSDADFFSVVHAVARHHGDLADVKALLSGSEREKMLLFLAPKPYLPVASFLRNWLTCADFEIADVKFVKLLTQHAGMSDKALVKIENKLNYFLELQYGFSCLVEADKRDAGNNYWYRRADQTEWAATQFTPSLNLALASVASAKPLNEVRTHLREEALGNVGPALDAGKRILSLTAPTGSGKTLALLAIANSIRERRPDHAVIFAVPFLSITEQIEDICRNLVFAGNPSFVTRIDSRTEDPELEEILRGLDADPARFDEMLSRSFSIETFDAAFVVTTFVQFFETLLSNKGTTLLRLPNFAKCIFLIDEVQALPPRLYAFFAAYLDAFCKLVDSYAVLSTATMPAFGLSTNPGAGWDAAQLFPDYTPPIELVSVDRWYPNPVFNRYRVERLDATLATFTLADLSRHVVGQKTSSLIILNTIDDTRSLYDLLSDDSDTDAEIVLLNTRFVLNDRREKIDLCKKMLLSGSRVVLISTQLIEAGVDIDFPTVYRDLCPLPSLIQSAGRCNRNGENVAGGQVNFFELRDANGMSRAERVYRDQSDRWILDFSREQISGVLEERDLIEVQRSFFKLVESNLEVGAHRLSSQNRKSRDSLVKRISECAFEVVGSFRLIDKDEFGKDYQIYVPIDESDRGWDDLGDLTKAAARAGASAPSGRLSFAETKHHRLKIDSCIQRMSGRVVQVRTFREDALPPCERLNGQVKEIYGMRKLLLPEVHYSAETGIKLNGTGAAII